MIKDVQRTRGVEESGARQILTPEQNAWLQDSEQLWQEAHAIAAQHPGDDASDIYHALRSLRLSPTERLRRGLTRGRLRTQPR